VSQPLIQFLQQDKIRPNRPIHGLEDVRLGIGQTLLFKRCVWGQLKAGLALPSRGCALFGIAPSRSTVDAGIGHSSSAVLESVSDLQRFLAEALSALGVLPGLLQAGSLVLSEFLQSIGKVENVAESGTLDEPFGEDWELFIANFLIDAPETARSYGSGVTAID